MASLSRSAWLVPFVLAPLACKGGDSPPTDSSPVVEGDTDSDMDADSDSDADSDADSDSDADTDADGDCDAGDVLSQGNDWVQVSVGNYFACGVRSDHRLQCWGANTMGELDVPEGEYVYVNAGNGFACGIRTDGQGVCWGNGRRSEMLFYPFGGSLRDVASTSGCTCYVEDGGDILCSGVSDACPASVNGSFLDVEVEYDHILALGRDGEITCYGENERGQCDAPGGPWRDIGAGAGFSCALDVEGGLWCWGDDYSQLFGWLDPTDAPLGDFVQFDTDVDRSCAISVDGSVVSWGGYGEALPGHQGNFQQVDCGVMGPICAVQQDGHLRCWSGYAVCMPD